MITSTLADRITEVTHPLGQKLCKIMCEKRSNLTLSADVESSEELLRVADELGPKICVLKTHVDCLSDFRLKTIHELAFIAREHGFLIFEDRKFADISHTAERQYEKGIYEIASWAHIVNAHALPGPSLIEGLRRVSLRYQDRGLLLLANMSSEGALFNSQYRRQVFALANAYRDFVFGFVSPSLSTTLPGFINFHPGVHLSSASDHNGQQYLNPDNIKDRTVDIFIVGRGILGAQNRVEAAEQYRRHCWGRGVS